MGGCRFKGRRKMSHYQRKAFQSKVHNNKRRRGKIYQGKALVTSEKGGTGRVLSS